MTLCPNCFSDLDAVPYVGPDGKRMTLDNRAGKLAVCWRCAIGVVFDGDGRAMVANIEYLKRVEWTKFVALSRAQNAVKAQWDMADEPGIRCLN